MARFKKLEYKFLVDDVYSGIYIEYDDTLSITDIAQHIAGSGLEIEEVQRGTKGKGFQKALVTLKNTKNESRDEILRILDCIDGVKYAKYVF